LQEGARLVIGWYYVEEWQDTEPLLSEYKDQYVSVKAAVVNYGKLDCLVNTVGMFSIGPALWETDLSVMEKLIRVNLISAFICTKYAVKEMLNNNKGRIIFFPAKYAIEPEPKFGAYGVSKAGLLTLANALSQELKNTDITVNSIVPSAVDTYKTRNIPGSPVDKFVKVPDIVDTLCYLCSDSSQAVNGSVIKMYGKM
ncbi:MAG: SDR family oxidoreductase, partial [Clostridiales bacterium]|nr:SDR family oxidoreductase [Clostridiales bacterium]